MFDKNHVHVYANYEYMQLKQLHIDVLRVQNCASLGYLQYANVNLLVALIENEHLAQFYNSIAQKNIVAIATCKTDDAELHKERYNHCMERIHYHTSLYGSLLLSHYERVRTCESVDYVFNVDEHFADEERFNEYHYNKYLSTRSHVHSLQHEVYAIVEQTTNRLRTIVDYDYTAMYDADAERIHECLSNANIAHLTNTTTKLRIAQSNAIIAELQYDLCVKLTDYYRCLFVAQSNDDVILRSGIDVRTTVNKLYDAQMMQTTKYHYLYGVH